MSGVLWLGGGYLGLLLLSPLSAQQPKLRGTLKGHTGGVISVAYSPDGKTLASCSSDGTVKLWDVATGQERASLRGHTDAVLSVAYSPGGKTLASGSRDSKTLAWEGRDHSIKLWDVTSGKQADK